MSRAVVLGLTLLVGVFAVFALWRTSADRGEIEHAELEGVQEEHAEPDVVLTPPGSGESVASKVPAPVDVAAEMEDSGPAAQRSAVERPRISGTVRVQGGIPVGEVVKVRAEVFPKSGTSGAQKLATRVAGDGTFTLAVPENTSHALLDLESRFFLLEKSVNARPGERGVELMPFVCAVIEGKVVPPLSPSTSDVAWTDMRVSWALDMDPELPWVSWAAPLSPSRFEPARPNGEGAFSLALVPVGIPLVLRVENPFGPQWVQRVEPLGPAEVREVEVTLELGITISGRVIDEHGVPVVGVQISTDEERRSTPLPKTDADGRFVLDLMPGRVLRISTQGKDLASEAEATVDGSAGDVDDLLLTVVRGGCIEGTVLWPDRSPVDGFELRASGPSREGKYVEGSRFRLCGLNDGSYRVEVRALRGEVAGTAECSDVRPGAAPVELVLTEVRVFEVRGVVLDEQDAKIDRFSVRATRLSPKSKSRTADEPPDGTFVLVGMEAGEWILDAEAEGFQSSRQQIVVGEGALPLLRIVLPRAGRVRGRVVDPAGAPVADAWVGEERDAFRMALPGRRNGSTDSDGRFELQLSSTRARILAGKPGSSPSEIQEYEVGPGETLEGIVLRLRDTCRVVGRVLDEHGDPLPGASVTVDWLATTGGPIETDAQGAFELEGLPPGTSILFAFHPQRDDVASATVTLAPGEPGAVNLRFEPADPVLVRGRVTRGGKPVECCLGFRSRSSGIECASDANGRLEVTLKRPGDWRAAVWLARDPFSIRDLARSDVRRFEITVPDADEFAFELDFDTLPRLTSMEELLR